MGLTIFYCEGNGDIERLNNLLKVIYFSDKTGNVYRVKIFCLICLGLVVVLYFVFFFLDFEIFLKKFRYNEIYLEGD